MRRSMFRIPVVALTIALLCATVLRPVSAAAQSSLLMMPIAPKVTWYGPFGISPNDTARFVYTNLGADTVRIEWQFSNAETGELVCGNLGKPVTVAPGQGKIWDYSQTLAVDPYTMAVTETRNCDGVRQVTDEVYFDSKFRHELVGWLFIQHESKRGVNNAVDLGTVQLFNSMVMSMTDANGQPMRSMTFGRTMEVIHANPTAPADFPRALLNR